MSFAHDVLEVDFSTRVRMSNARGPDRELCGVHLDLLEAAQDLCKARMLTAVDDLKELAERIGAELPLGTTWFEEKVAGGEAVIGDVIDDCLNDALSALRKVLRGEGV